MAFYRKIHHFMCVEAVTSLENIQIRSYALEAAGTFFFRQCLMILS